MQQFLQEVHGQKRVKESLNNIFLSKKIPQSMLFVGPEGVGKYFTAIQFIKLINSTDNELLNEINYKRISSIAEPYLKLIYPLPRGKNEADDNSFQGLSDIQLNDVKEQIRKKKVNPYHKISITGAESIKISSIREINQFTSLMFDDLNYRLIAIIDAHLMSTESQNALLKNLEEPPEGIIFILFTTDDNLLLSTIRSRCWKVQFEPLNDEDLLLILEKYYSFNKEEIDKIKYFGNGSVQNTIFLLENDLNSIINKTINILRYSFAGWYSSALAEFKDILKNSDYDLMRIIIKLIFTWINNLIKFRNNEVNNCYKLFLDSISKFNSKFYNVNFDEVIVRIDTLNQYLDKNVNLNIVAVNIILELSMVTINEKV
ncbi:MAG: hypothetical protein V1773_05235 [bacterium]